MTQSKISAEKDKQAQQRKRKLATALRTNLRRRKDQTRERDATEGDDGQPASSVATEQT